eukprot:2851172-Rhodomonas_salina.1
MLPLAKSTAHPCQVTLPAARVNRSASASASGRHAGRKECLQLIGACLQSTGIGCHNQRQTVKSDDDDEGDY